MMRLTLFVIAAFASADVFMTATQAAPAAAGDTEGAGEGELFRRLLDAVQPPPPQLARLQYYFAHIPKAGGTSFVQEVSKGHVNGLLLCHSHHGKQGGTLSLDVRLPTDGPPPPPPPPPPSLLARGRRLRPSTRLEGLWSNPLALKAAPPNCTLAASEKDTIPKALSALGKIGIASQTVRVLTVVREPLGLLLSEYGHCQAPGSQGMRLHHYPHIGLSEWLALHASGRKEEAERYCNHDVYNPQTRVLGGSQHSLQAAVDAIDHSLFFVGVLEHFDASLCALRSLIVGRAACACPDSHSTRFTEEQTTAHKVHGNNASLWTPTLADRATIAALTANDAFVYARGRSRLYDDLRRFDLLCLLDATSTAPKM